MDEQQRKRVADRLEFYEELGIEEFYLRRSEPAMAKAEPRPSRVNSEARPAGGNPATSTVSASTVSMSKDAEREPRPSKIVFGETPVLSTINAAVPLQTAAPAGPVAQSLSLFESPPPAKAPPEQETLEQIREDLGDCHRCQLAAGRNKIVFGQGNPHAELVFVGEGPGADEDAQGLPFVGRAGRLLNRMIELAGMKREEVYICNIVKCRPPGNRTPLPDEIEMCSPFLLRQIRAINPRLVCCLGAPAVKTLLGVKEGITKIRGRFYDFHGTKALATVHPAYILRNPREEKIFREDFQKIVEYLKSPR